MNAHCPILNEDASYQLVVPMDWVALSLTDKGFLCSIFIASCRHMLRYQPHEQRFMRLAIQYKLTSLQTLNTTILGSSSSLSDSTVANVIALAIDEVKISDTVSLSRLGLTCSIR